MVAAPRPKTASQWRLSRIIRKGSEDLLTRTRPALPEKWTWTMNRKAVDGITPLLAPV